MQYRKTHTGTLCRSQCTAQQSCCRIPWRLEKVGECHVFCFLSLPPLRKLFSNSHNLTPLFVAKTPPTQEHIGKQNLQTATFNSYTSKTDLPVGFPAAFMQQTSLLALWHELIFTDGPLVHFRCHKCEIRLYIRKKKLPEVLEHI